MGRAAARAPHSGRPGRRAAAYAEKAASGAGAPPDGMRPYPKCSAEHGMGVLKVSAEEYPAPPAVVGRGAVFVEHRLKVPQVPESAYIAPTAVLAGDVTVGPHTHLTGCVIEGGSRIATGAVVFNGARIETGAEVEFNAVVYVNTVVPAGMAVPMGWFAGGQPAELVPPDDWDRIRAIMGPLDYPGTVFGVGAREAPMPDVARRYARGLAL